VQRVFTADRSATQLKRKNETYGYDKYSDKRFDSVVVVRNTGTGIGTGFYVTDDMVITNYHVVEESNYVQLKRFDERETMGRVIARDALLDLALIQADVRGKPVCFYDKRKLPLGETLEIIGHPQGLEFSITRGVISAIRKIPPINFMESTNSKVMYIQTDASSNGGNSGGPVFYGDYVVGVHDWGIKKTGANAPAQGLNFSIHYNEVFDFLDHNGIRVCKGGK
jgi:S1-C subfamily serine protease